VRTSRHEATAAQRTDASGRFRFTDVPVNVPLQLHVRNDPGDPEYFLFDRERMLNPGEVRENERVKPRPANRSAPTAVRPPAPLARSVGSLCRDAGPAGMRVLLILLGDDSVNTAAAADQVLDYERDSAVLNYLTARVGRDRLDADVATLTSNDWPRPGAGEVVLVALDGNRKTLATRRIAINDVASAASAGADFVRQHKPPARDALRAIADARSEARRSGRRVWVVIGGPRCGPCFRMGHWIEQNHATLEKDYVIVKVMEGVDAHASDVAAGLPIKPGEGIPWHAITEPDGTILTTSVGPLGNIGFPTSSSVDESRHLRRMIERTAGRLTPSEVDGLVNPLGTGR
jgi:hypothetical protein